MEVRQEEEEGRGGRRRKRRQEEGGRKRGWKEERSEWYSHLYRAATNICAMQVAPAALYLTSSSSRWISCWS